MGNPITPEGRTFRALRSIALGFTSREQTVKARQELQRQSHQPFEWAPRILGSLRRHLHNQAKLTQREANHLRGTMLKSGDDSQIYDAKDILETGGRKSGSQRRKQKRRNLI